MHPPCPDLQAGLVSCPLYETFLATALHSHPTCMGIISLYPESHPSPFYGALGSKYKLHVHMHESCTHVAVGILHSSAFIQANFLPNLTDSRLLQVAQVLRSQDMAIFVLMIMTQPITFNSPPCACTQGYYDSPCYYQLSKDLAVYDLCFISASGLMPLW